MSNVFVMSFATEDFEPLRSQMESSAMKFNLNKFHSYTKYDLISSDFYKKNKHVFNYNRGFGLWLWKPYFILNSLLKINDGDILFYVDSGSKFISNPSPLIKIAQNNKSGIVAFDCWPIINKEFVKRSAFINMGCNSEFYWNGNHVIATAILFRKSEKTILFVKEWLEECSFLKTLLPEVKQIFDNNFPEFIAHREDQSVFSVLIRKYNIETYRNPSKWGDFLKTVEFRESNDNISYPYLLNDSIKNYSDKPYSNSNYSTIFEFNRKLKIEENSKIILIIRCFWSLKNQIKKILKLNDK